MKSPQISLRFHYCITPTLAFLLLLVLAAGCDDPAKKSGTYVPPEVCKQTPDLPKPVEIWIDDAHATSHVFDDSAFAIDREGRVVTVDRAGDVVRRAHDGTVTVLAEGVVKTARGLAYLSTGELVVADSGRGKLVLVYPDGQSRILTQHLDLPYGICVDRDDTIYVAESSRGAVSRVHPRTGQVVTVVTGLPFSPSGISFSPDYLSLYIVGSTNQVHVISRDASGRWGEVHWFATVPGALRTCEGLYAGEVCNIDGALGTCQYDRMGTLVCVPDSPPPCEGGQAGDSCDAWGTQGTCADDGVGGLYCAPIPACEGKAAGDSCVEWGMVGICTDDGAGGLFCREVGPCEGKIAGDPCTSYGDAGFCHDDGQGVLWCRIPSGCEGKQVADPCLSDWQLGSCVLDGGQNLWCEVPPPCEGKVAGDPCLRNGSPGICIWDTYGGLVCDNRPPCEGKIAGDACIDSGAAGACVDGGEGYLWCEPAPVCQTGADQSACAWGGITPGVCLDSTQGYAYCQSEAVCAGLLEGQPCYDAQLRKVGACLSTDAGLVCALVNPCLAAGQECVLSGYGGGLPDDGADERMIAPPPETLGTCLESGEGLFYCAPRGACWELAEGDACRTDWGTPGICVDYGEDQLQCEERTACVGLSAGDSCLTPEGQAGTCADDGRGNLVCVEFVPCDGLSAGDACVAADGTTGACLDDGRGELYCSPAPACADKTAGDACQSPADGLPGTCVLGAGDLLVCRPTPPCEGKAHGDACTAAGGHAGSCVYLGQGLDALFCDARRPGGLLRAVTTDACGNVYVAEAGTRMLWRFTPEGVAEWVASELRAPVTGLFWGTGVGGWERDTLHLGHEGGARVSRIDLGIPGRPLVTPKRSDTTPAAGLATNLDDACLLVPDAPLEVNQLEAPRGFHDVTFDDRGWMVGYNGNALVAVSHEGASQAVSLTMNTVQGLAALPDGSIVASTVETGVHRIHPSGAMEALAPDIQDAYGVTVGPDGLVYVSDHAKVHRIDPTTKEVTTFLDPAEFGQTWQPRNVAFDPDHSLMVISSFGDSVYVVALDENLERVGSPRKLGRVVPDGMWLDALAVDSCGNIYVPNFGSFALFRMSPDGRSRLYHQWDDSQYGHGGDWGVALGGWRTDALYMPQPYNLHKVIEMVVGVPGVGR